MRLFIIALLFAISYAQTGPLYSSEGTYSNPTRADAQAKCSDVGMSLCTVGQVFNAVYNEGFANLCYSGWFADDYEGSSSGWFNNEEGSCSGTGFQSWSPANPGAHCCSSSLAAVAPTNCASYDCLAQGDYISVDDASSVFCASGTCDVDTCCQSWVAAPEYITLPLTFPRYIYAEPEEANDACAAYHPDLQLCTQDEVQGASVTNSICASGFWVTSRDENNANSGYGQGWYIGENFANDCGGQTGLREWKPASGLGAAHCCVKSYQKSGYRVINKHSSDGEYNTEGASAYCQSLGYSYDLCSQAQLEQVVKMTNPNICMSGFMSDASGWYQGDVTVQGCGTANTFSAWLSPVAGAHCCLSSRVVAEAGGPYGIIPSSGIYAQSTMSSGAVAAQACEDAGYDQLCTIGQQAYVEDNPSEYGDIACKVGWAQDGDGGYDAGYWSGCGTADTWNNNWRPAGNPVAHCCAADVPEVSMVQYPYYNGGWNTYTYDVAAGFCTGDYALCTQDQVELIATEGVTFNGVTQLEDSICKQGWYLDGSMGWYQGAAGSCGATGSRSFVASVATYHCCLGFEADLGTTQAPDPVVFIQEPATGYPYNNAQDAEDACKAVNSEYNLCADYEIIEVATSGIAAVDGWQGIEAQTNLCYTVYTDPERSENHLYGWYVSESGSCAGGGPAWKSWRSSGVFAGAYCCYSPAFADPATEAPVETEEPTESLSPTLTPTVATTMDPTVEPSMEITMDPTADPTAATTSIDPSETLPSSLPISGDCQDTGFKVEGFDTITFCALDGFVYLNGRNTCVPSTGAEDVMHNSLATVWNDQWYLAAEPCDRGLTYDEATQDQLWITNEMCNNLEKEIEELETSTANYMDGWTQSVIDLVNANKGQFTLETQQALDAYLDTLQNGQN